MEFDPKETLVRSHQSAKKVLEECDYNDFSPTLVVYTKSGDIYPVILAGVGSGQMLDAVKAFVSQMSKVRLTPEDIEFLVLHADVYVRRYDVEDPEGLELRAGDLSRQFKQGSTQVEECLVSMMISRDGTPQLQQPYKHSVQDGFEWGEVREFEDANDPRWEWQEVFGGAQDE